MPFTSDVQIPPFEKGTLSAVVNIGQVLPDDNDAQYVDTGDPQAIFTDYEIENTYIRDPAILTGGITSPIQFQGQSVAFVQMNASMLTWVCRWTACRCKLKPILPSKEPSDSRWVLVREEYISYHVGVAPDGITPVYRLSGIYTYHHKNPDQVGIEAVNFPRVPMFDDSFVRTLDGSDFAVNLIDVAGGQGSQKKGTGV